MLFKTKKHAASVCPKTGRPLERNREKLFQNRHPERNEGSGLSKREILRCAQNDIRFSKYRWLKWLFPVTGLLSLIWFLIRVLPKPSRATYPCQRLAAPLASGFVVWITGLIGSALAYRKAKRLFQQSRYLVGAVCAAVAVMMVWWSLSINAGRPAGAWTPTDPPNSPVGVAKGIFPGRVVWIYDPNATSWNGTTGSWWSDTNTNQAVVNSMMLKTLQCLTGKPDVREAWDALFKHFNQTHGFGDVGYQSGEKIVIKINMNQQDNWNAWGAGAGMPSPHVIYTLVDHLINVVGVPASAITIYDAARYIGDPIYNKVRSNPNFLSVTFVVKNTLAGNGRVAATNDAANPVYTKAPTAYLPTCVTGAKYLINMALLRTHQMYGITLCAKNNFGSVYFPNNGGWTPSPLHDYGRRENAMGTYNCLVELNGHRHLSGKTLLYMIDGLYGARHQSDVVIRWLSFGDDWCSSIFASQDPVAIDSVGLDFMRNESRCTEITGNPDNYLHEMARANAPPSGTVYDPERDGTRLASLGVHEHWNNATSKQYSRNLGTGDGIELVTRPWTSPNGPVRNLTLGRRYDYIQYAIYDANPHNQIVVGEGVYNENIDFGGKNLTIKSSDPNDPAVVAATIINGGSKGEVLVFSGGEDANCVFAGFTVTGGTTGIYCSNTSNPVIENCVIDEAGKVAIELGRNSNPAIIDCTVIGEVLTREVTNLNTAQVYDYIQSAVDEAIAGDQIVAGRGTYYESVDFKGKNLMVRSTEPNDSAIVAATIIRGGNQVVSFASGEDANCVLAGLTITGGNRGIYCNSSAPRITKCVIAENRAEGLYANKGNLSLTNCIIADNSGAGFTADGGSKLSINNCTIVANRGSGIKSTASTATIVNSVLRGNLPAQITRLLSTITVNYSDIQGGWSGGQGNMDVEPFFADPNSSDYHLKSQAGRWEPNQKRWVYDVNTTSLCIDGGDPNSNWTAELWPNGRCINIGSYGGTPEASMSLSTIGNIADLNNDSNVDIRDFAIFANNWLNEVVLSAENLDRTAFIDLNDLAVFVENWLWQEQ